MKSRARSRPWRDDSRYSCAKSVLAWVDLADSPRSDRFVHRSFAARAGQSRRPNRAVHGAYSYPVHRLDASMPSPKTIRSFRALAPGICALLDFLSGSRSFRRVVGRNLVRPRRCGYLERSFSLGAGICLLCDRLQNRPENVCCTPQKDLAGSWLEPETRQFRKFHVSASRNSWFCGYASPGWIFAFVYLDIS